MKKKILFSVILKAMNKRVTEGIVVYYPAISQHYGFTIGQL